MKKLIGILVLVLAVCYLPAQSTNTNAEAEVRQIEEAERRAVLKKDTNILKQIWSKDFIVNAPNNRVVVTGESVADRPVIAQMSYASFTREIEEILIKGDIVFSMGSEIVVPTGDNPRAGDEIKRRYTNVWMKQEGTWKLVARHASEICK
jgi:ketosteroid isomerase-like protein